MLPTMGVFGEEVVTSEHGHSRGVAFSLSRRTSKGQGKKDWTATEAAYIGDKPDT